MQPVRIPKHPRPELDAVIRRMKTEINFLLVRGHHADVIAAVIKKRYPAEFFQQIREYLALFD